jgi:hypothetical protein
MKKNCKYCGKTFIVNKHNKLICCEIKKRIIYRRRYEKQYRFKNKEHIKKYRMNPENKKRASLYNRNRYDNARKKYMKLYQKKHIQRINELSNNYYYKNKEKQNSRARTNKLWNRIKVLKIIGNRCIVCGVYKSNKKIKIHHKRYIQLPCYHSLEKNFDEITIKKIKRNLFPMCKKCHSDKHLKYRKETSPNL